MIRSGCNFAPESADSGQSPGTLAGVPRLGPKSRAPDRSPQTLAKVPGLSPESPDSGRNPAHQTEVRRLWPKSRDSELESPDSGRSPARQTKVRRLWPKVPGLWLGSAGDGLHPGPYRRPFGAFGFLGLRQPGAFAPGYMPSALRGWLSMLSGCLSVSLGAGYQCLSGLTTHAFGLALRRGERLGRSPLPLWLDRAVAAAGLDVDVGAAVAAFGADHLVAVLAQGGVGVAHPEVAAPLA